MDSINPKQLTTLQNWVKYNGNRLPGKKVMGFLCSETQLSEQQILWWWENVTPPKYHKEAKQFHSRPPTTPQIKMNSTPNSEHTKRSPPLPSDYHFQSMVDFELYPPTQEMKAWSPIGQGENSYEAPFDFNVSQDTQPWSSSTRSSQNRFTSSTSASSMMDNHLLSPSSVPGRASYGSSLWSADKASTMHTVYNPHLHDFIEEEPAIPEAQLTQPITYSQPGLTHLSWNSAQENLNHFSDHNIIPNPASDRPPPVPPKAQTTYTCTICHRAFMRKDDWRRHEESHDPQKYWICMIGDPAVPVEGGRMCVFCDRFFSKTQREEMNIHLVKEHRINECAHNNPKWHRKDKLKAHLLQVHNLSEDTLGLWEEWNRDVRKKWAWGCGYCGVCLLTWKDRVNHIAEHYEKQGLVSYSWDESLVVRGLMKQRYSDFNVDDAWRVLNPNGDQFLKWSSGDARTLKKKLEGHSESPETIATEAKNMATNFVTNYETLAWTSADSRVATLTNPIEYNDIQKACRAETRELPSQKALPTYPVSMDFDSGAPNFI